VRPVAFQLCLITDGQHPAEAAIAAALDAVPAGSAAVQLRNRSLGGRELLRLGERLRNLTHKYGAPLLVNDRLDVALAVGADGVHLPAHGLPLRAARCLLGEQRLISAAAHSLSEIRTLVRNSADFVTFGPIWPTPSKPADSSIPAAQRVLPIGISGLTAATAELGPQVPIFALGGIDTAERAAACAAAGARVAAIRGVLGAAEPAAAARAFLEAVRRSA